MDCENSKEVESAETILLNLSRHGNTEEIEKLLLQSTNVDINHIGMCLNFLSYLPWFFNVLIENKFNKKCICTTLFNHIKKKSFLKMCFHC